MQYRGPQVWSVTMVAALAIAAVVLCPSSLASSDRSYREVDRASSVACARASGLLKPVVGPATSFSDVIGIDLRAVSGIWPQAHMKGAQAKMLCAYDRRTKRAEAQEQER
jgi:hypothetical protein